MLCTLDFTYRESFSDEMQFAARLDRGEKAVAQETNIKELKRFMAFLFSAMKSSTECVPDFQILLCTRVH
jgi:hypothetical protein